MRPSQAIQGHSAQPMNRLGRDRLDDGYGTLAALPIEAR